MSIVTDFKSINRKLERMEQKAEIDAKAEPAPALGMYGWPYGAAVPMQREANYLKVLADYRKGIFHAWDVTTPNKING